MGVNGEYPNYEAVMPSEFTCTAHLDTQEALKAVRSLKATAENPREYHIDLTIAQGQMTMTNTDDRGEVVVKADGDGEAFIRVNGEYLATVMRSLGGMVDFSLSKPYAPMLFTSNGFRAVVMPVMSQKATAQQRADTGADEPTEPAGEAEPTESESTERTQPEAELDGEPTEAELQAIEAEQESEAEKPRRQRSRRREKVAVA